jgi:hypothetical protein
MGASSGLDIVDQSLDGRTSSIKTLTNNGGIVVSTSVSKFYGGSADLTTNNRYFSLANSSDFDFGTGDFTIECWVYPTSTSGNLLNGYDPINEFGFSTANGLAFGRSGSFGQNLGGTITQNTWQHVALVRSGATVTGYINGVACPTTYNISTNTVSFTTGTGTLIGRTHISAGTPSFCPAYLQDYRVYKGTAKYTGPFNPPSSTQLPTIAAGNDSLVDTPTNYGVDTGLGSEVRGNYCTLNPLAAGATLTNGNLDFTCNGSSTLINRNARATFAMPSSGKWYWEVTVTAFGEMSIGVVDWFTGLRTMYYRYDTGGWQNIYISDVQTAAVVGYTNGDIIGVGYDSDNQQIRWYKNGVQVGTNYSITNNGRLIPFIDQGSVSGSCSGSVNFGQRPFAYQAPSGFKSLNTANLPTPTITRPSSFFDTVLWTGNGVNGRSITGLSFNPDFVWIKNRSSGTYWHGLFDVIRGTAMLFSNTTNAELLAASNNEGYLSSYNSDGFSLTTGTSGFNNVNANSSSYVAWAWDAGTTTVTNTSGTIQSQVRANPSSGFSIVSYTGNGTLNASVGHGLNAKPTFVIFKNRSSAQNWPVITDVIDGSKDYLYLNSTAAKGDAASTANTSSIMYLSSSAEDNGNGNSMIAYCFAPVSGFSAFGTYTGNGSADGPMIWTGFRPRWIMFKRTDTTGDWVVIDPSNVTSKWLFANLSDVETTVTQVDFLSNGFKARGTGTNVNASGSTYIYAAFAENPFSLARAR